MGDNLWLLECLSSEAADRILSLRSCWYGSARVSLDLWTEAAGWTSVMSKQKRTWLLFRGIPLHLRSMDLFRSLGDLCGGFLDSDTSLCSWNAVWIKVGSAPVLPERISLRFGNERFEVVVVKEVSEGRIRWRFCYSKVSLEISRRSCSPIGNSGLEEVRLRWIMGKQKVFEEGGPLEVHFLVGTGEGPHLTLSKGLSETMCAMDSDFCHEEDLVAAPGFEQIGWWKARRRSW
ncbi:hypothetical protein LINPERPRIM_LOCUS110 [Linum perenne]